ncbi:hypothetical protein [Leclercia sp.]|uniref:hypothetical protein n=1 Tax=Leclercia sp. TaxID=1898428 RepID=UPI0028BD8E5D|nr:hypothetical protein [Leclercia sp.]
MRENYLSTFKPATDAQSGGIKVIPLANHVVAVAVKAYPFDLSQQARDVHQWILQHPAGVLVSDLIKANGYKLKRPYGMPDTKTMRGFPLEELYDHSLLYVVEERRPEAEDAE